MYIDAKEFFEVVGIKATDKEIFNINNLYTLRNRNLTNVDDVINIVSLVAKENEITFNDITGNSRKWEIVEARAEATYVLNLLGFKDVTINKVFKKDHSTIVYYRQKVKDAMSISNKYKVQFYNKYCHILERFQIANNSSLN